MISFVRKGKNPLGAGLKSGSTNAEGEYSLRLNEPGDYDVSIQKFGSGGAQQNLVEFARTVPEGKEARLDFELPTGRISGRVEGAEGKPLAGARVSIVIESAGEAGTMWGGQYNETLTDNEGRYDVPALRPGQYTVLAGGLVLGGLMGDSGGVHGREAKQGIALSEGEWIKGVDFRLKLPGTIDVTVVDEAGAPVGGAAVFARTRSGELVERFSMFTTGADGVCAYGGLAPGRYTLSAREGARTSGESAEVEVRSGEHSAARVVLATGTYVLVNVVDAEQKPLRASISVRDEQGREVGAMVTMAELMKYMSEGPGPGDEQRVGPFAPGRYKVTAILPDGRTVSKPVTLSGQGERKLNLRF
jgi:protocatechuate 3,4-dioxygenase beta subunit